MPSSRAPIGGAGVATMPFRVSMMARASLAVLALTFVALGALRPTGLARTGGVALAAVAFIALNVPTAMWLARRRPFDVFGGAIVGLLLLRCLAAVWIFSLVGSLRGLPAPTPSGAPSPAPPEASSTP